MKHELKCWPEYFQAIIDGRKRFEVRKDDRVAQYGVGDELHLREYVLAEDRYTGREATCDVLYILAGESWALQPGIVVMSIDLQTTFDEYAV